MKRDLLLDYLKLIAILAVVMIHLPETEYVRHMIFPLDPNAVFATIAGMFMVFDVPFMKWFNKRWMRLMVPYLIWEVIYAVVGIAFDVLMHKFEMPSINELYHWVFWGGASVQLWFVVMLFYVQLALWTVVNLCRKLSSNPSIFAAFAVLSIGGIFWNRFVTQPELHRLVFLCGYCSFGVVLRVLYDRVVGDRLMSGRCVGVCKYTMGIYLCHFLFTRVVTMIYPYLLGLMAQVLAVVVETTLAFGASVLLVHFTHKRFYWLWGMKK